jgi:ribosomal protein S18 acetylase RimI-like enzyme
LSAGESRTTGAALPCLLAISDGQIVGMATYAPTGADCELVTLDAFEPRRGIGTALLARAVDEAAARRCRRLWLITTNDNVDALRFYQRRGLRIVAVHRGAVDEARLAKPSIAAVGEYGIPLHDELELEFVISS